MLPKPDEFSLVTSWTNGEKAVVHLLENSRGERLIMKEYRRGFLDTMFREYLAARYVASRLSVVPKVFGFRPWRKELFFEYVPGQRVLEWVLQRFGDKNILLSEFQSFHGLDPCNYVDPRVAEAFARFRQTTSEEAHRLKHAIKASYSCLHQIGILHGSADPRNVIYDEDRVVIIDFDHARPSLNPAKLEYRSLGYWYGLYQESSCEF